jgi:hypothetical protein
MSRSESTTATCITCGDVLHPERARKYDYCMKAECQAKNLKGLTMVAVGVNKSAEQYMLLDDDTKADLAQGKYHDQRRGTFGAAGAAPVQPGSRQPGAGQPGAGQPETARRAPAAVPAARGPAPGGGPAQGRAAAPREPRLPGTPSQRRLAVLYNQQGLRPDEIARKLGLSRYDVTQIILAARSRGKG